MLDWTQIIMRKLKYHIAATVDGFIAHSDHTVDGFLQEGEHVKDYLDSLKNDYDVVLMGRKTYEFGLQFGVTDPYPWMKEYVVSHTMKSSPDANVELVSDNIVGLVKELKEKEGKAIYLCGGAKLAAELLDEELIDEIVLKLNPVIFGTGISLFSGVSKQTNLKLTDSKIYDNSVILLNYQVNY